MMQMRVLGVTDLIDVAEWEDEDWCSAVWERMGQSIFYFVYFFFTHSLLAMGHGEMTEYGMGGYVKSRGMYV